MSNASFYKWQAKYGGMEASLINQMKTKEDENRRLKRMYADLSVQADLLKEALEESDEAVSTPRDGRQCGGATWGEHCPCLQGLRGERDLRSLWPEVEGRTLQGAHPKLAYFCSATVASFYAAVDKSRVLLP